MDKGTNRVIIPVALRQRRSFVVSLRRYRTVLIDLPGNPVRRGKLDIRYGVEADQKRLVLARFVAIADSHVGQHQETVISHADCVGRPYRRAGTERNVIGADNPDAGFQRDAELTTLR